MAAAAAAHYGRDCEGIVIQPADPSGPPAAIPGFRHYRAPHPVPDARSVVAARAALDLASALAADDLLLVLLSGGGSALMSLPARGVTLAEKQALSRRLLACGASIREINCVRKQLSRIKGGRLARASQAPVVTLAISDVPGDDPASIASGPTVRDRSTPAEARAVLARHAIDLPAGIHEALHRPPSDPNQNPALEDRDQYHIVASGMTALQAAAAWCRSHDVQPVVLGDALQGEARELARQHARLALELASPGRSACIFSGGETTVTLEGSAGRGGRNTEYALALALALDSRPGIWALAADTDGVDGSGGHSGAFVGPDTLQRAARVGLEADSYLRRHDSAGFFEQIGGLLAEGPTGTNVNDFRAILVHA